MKKADLTLDRFKEIFKGRWMIRCKQCGFEWVTKAQRDKVCCPRCHGYTPKKEAVLIE